MAEEYAYLTYTRISASEYAGVIATEVGAVDRVKVTVLGTEWKPNGDVRITMGGPRCRSECLALKTRLDAAIGAKLSRHAEPNVAASDCRTGSDVVEYKTRSLPASSETVVEQR